MLAAFRRFLAAPVFSEDEDKTISAAMAHYGILFGLVANLVHLPVLLLAGDPLPRSIVLTGAVVAGLLLNHYFLQRGYVRSSSAIFIAVAWVVLAGANYTAGGVEAPGFSIHIVFVICAGFVFGGPGAFFAAGVSSLLGVLFMVLERRGLLPPASMTNTPARHAILMTSTFFVVAAILSIMVHRLRTTIVAARRELLMRRESERRLEEHQAALEETVRARTETIAQTNDALLREIDVRCRAEEALRQEKDFIARLMETSPVGVVVVDADAGFTFANAAAERVLRRPRAEIARLGFSSADWGFTDHQGRPLAAVDLPFVRTAATGVPVRNAPLAVQTPEGTRVLLSVNVAPFGGEQDRPRRCVVTIEDVTDRERLEQEVFRAQRLESVGVLAGGIAHDFNNLLTGIMGNISLAQFVAPQGSPIAESLGEAEKVSLQARDLTRQLLTFSRGGTPVKAPVAVAEAVTHAVQLALRGSNVRGEFAFAPDLWTVEADQGQISQVFHNLGLNAGQSQPAGGTVDVEAVNVRLGAESGLPLPPGRYVRVSVTDHGVGIPPEHLEKIFDPFFTTRKEGTGLGLAVAYSIVKNHGGHIGLQSVQGAGSTFTVHLPAAEGLPQRESLPAAVSAGYGRVLLMDDEPTVRAVASRLLAAMGYDVHATADGAEALAAYRAARDGGNAFDAVILDLTVPAGMGGAETIRRLREMDPGVKAVVSSGYSEDPVMSSHREYGFCNVLPKPYRSGDLSRVMRAVLGNGGGDSAAE